MRTSQLEKEVKALRDEVKALRAQLALKMTTVVNHYHYHYDGGRYFQPIPAIPYEPWYTTATTGTVTTTSAAVISDA